MFATTIFLHRRNKVKRTLCRLQKAKISAEVDKRQKPSECRDKRTLLELREMWLWQVWVAAGRDLGSPFLMYFRWIC